MKSSLKEANKEINEEVNEEFNEIFCNGGRHVAIAFNKKKVRFLTMSPVFESNNGRFVRNVSMMLSIAACDAMVQQIREISENHKM